MIDKSTLITETSSDREYHATIYLSQNKYTLLSAIRNPEYAVKLSKLSLGNLSQKITVVSS